MPVTHLDELSPGPRAFATWLLAVHPELETSLTLYRPVAHGDTTEPGSLWLELPPVGKDGVPLTITVESTEALIALGRAEQLFVWTAPEQAEAHIEVLAAFNRALWKRAGMSSGLRDQTLHSREELIARKRVTLRTAATLGLFVAIGAWVIVLVRLVRYATLDWEIAAAGTLIAVLALVAWIRSRTLR